MPTGCDLININTVHTLNIENVHTFWVTFVSISNVLSIVCLSRNGRPEALKNVYFSSYFESFP